MKSTLHRSDLEDRGIKLWIRTKSAIAKNPGRNSALMFLSLFPLKYAIWHYTEESVPIFLLGVAMISISAGMRYGLYLSIPCFFAHYFFFTEPLLSFSIGDFGVLLNLFIYLMTLVSISLILGSQKEIEDESLTILRQQREWLGVVSHELKTPLNGIVGLSKMVREQNKNPQASEHLNLLEHSALQLRDLLTNLLDFSQTWSHQAKKTESAFDPVETLKKAADLLHAKADEKNISFVFTSEVSSPLILADAGKIQQIFMNLVQNAIKFTNQGQVQVHLSTEKRLEVLYFKITVEDTGVGIHPVDLPHVFEPFFRASEQAQLVEGTGIGLSMVRELTHLLDGEVGVTSTLGEGSKFWVTLPVREPLETQNLTSRDDSRLREKASALVAEDNRVNQIVMKDHLERVGFAVDVVNNGAEAVSQCRQSHYDVIFLDGQMPIMDGFTTAKAIRQLCESKNWPCPPLFGFTADTTPKSREKSVDAGMDFLFHKPLSENQLQSVLRQYLPDEKITSQKSMTDIERKIHDLFHSQLDVRLRQLEASLEKENFEEFSKRIHSFRSSCLAIDDLKAADLCRRLETLSDEKKLPELQENLRRLAASFEAHGLQSSH